MRTTPSNRVLARLKPALFIALAVAGLVPLSRANAAAGRSAADRPDATPPTTTAPAVRKYFPYTIRSGDTLETIADIFGVQVSDITHANRRIADGNLMAGNTIQIPNPFVTREAKLIAEVERLSIDKQEAEREAHQKATNLASLHSLLQTATEYNEDNEHDLHLLAWWLRAAWAVAIAGVVMFGMMLTALIEWWDLRFRYRAVAEINDSLRRLDLRYRMVMAKTELRLQQLYGRRRRGIEQGQDRPKVPEETKLQQLDQQIKETLENYLERLGPPNNRARRARWRELIGAAAHSVRSGSHR